MKRWIDEERPRKTEKNEKDRARPKRMKKTEQDRKQ
jgi:hypothetical protein